MIQDSFQGVANQDLFRELFSTFPEDWAQVSVDELDYYRFCFLGGYLRPTVEELFAFNREALDVRVSTFWHNDHYNDYIAYARGSEDRISILYESMQRHYYSNSRLPRLSDEVRADLQDLFGEDRPFQSIDAVHEKISHDQDWSSYTPAHRSALINLFFWKKKAAISLQGVEFHPNPVRCFNYNPQGILGFTENQVRWLRELDSLEQVNRQELAGKQQEALNEVLARYPA